MPVYKYFGKPALYHGKPLFHILSNLKNFGVGRIISRSSFEAEPSHNEKPSFYRILWVQPLMDDKSLEGRVVAERVRHGIRYTQPVQLQEVAPVPDFRLVAKDAEAEYCQWDKVRDFSAELDIIPEPKHYSMPPLLKLLMERNLKERNETPGEESFLLPRYKTARPHNHEHTATPGSKYVKEYHQEHERRFEGTADYNYSDLISDDLKVTDHISILDQLPEEPPMPAPAVGMRLYHWPDTSRRHKEDIRTEEHNTIYP